MLQKQDETGTFLVDTFCHLPSVFIRRAACRKRPFFPRADARSRKDPVPGTVPMVPMGSRDHNTKYTELNISIDNGIP